MRTREILCVVAALTCAEAWGSTTTWNGAAGNNLWIDPANWTAGVPGADDIAVIRNPTSDIQLGGDRVVRDLQLDGNVTLLSGRISPTAASVLGPSPTATINGTILVTNPSLVLAGASQPLFVNGPITGSNYAIRFNGRTTLLGSATTDQPMYTRRPVTLSGNGSLPNLPELDIWQDTFLLDNSVTALSGRLNPLGRVTHTSFLNGQLSLRGNSAAPITESIATLGAEYGMLSVALEYSGRATRLNVGRVLTSPNSVLGLLVDGDTTRVNSDQLPVRFGGLSGVEQNIVPNVVGLESSSDQRLFSPMTYDTSPHPDGGVVGFRKLRSNEFVYDTNIATPASNLRLLTSTTLSSPMSVNSLTVHPSVSLTLDVQLELASGVIWQVPGSGGSSGISGTGSIRSDQPLSILVPATGTSSLAFDITVPLNAPSLTIAGSKRVRLAGQNTLPDGVVVQSDAAVTIASPLALGTGPFAIGASSVTFEGSQTISNQLVIRSGEIAPDGQASFQGKSISIAAGERVTITSPVSGLGVISVQGGLLRLAGGGHFSGLIGGALSTGTIQLDGEWSSDPLFPITGAGQIVGNGHLPMVFEQGRISPGAPSAVGSLHIRELAWGTIAFREKTLLIDINGPIADTLIVDQLSTVELMPFSLAVNLLSPATPGSVYTVVDVLASGSMMNFAGLPEGSFLTQGGAQFRISYVGGDGNDVTLTVLPEPTGLALFGLLGIIGRRTRYIGSAAIS